MAIDNVVLTYHVKRDTPTLGNIQAALSISQEQNPRAMKSIPLKIKTALLDFTVDEDHSHDIAELTLAYSDAYHGKEYRGRIWGDITCSAGKFNRNSQLNEVRDAVKEMLKEAIIDYEKSPYAQKP
jgi:hypothetical protein